MSYYDRNESYLTKINQKMTELEGKPGEIARLFQKVYEVGFYGSYSYVNGDENRGGAVNDLFQLVMKGKETMDQILADGLGDFFRQLAGPPHADMLCQIIKRLPQYMFQHSSYRRSFRSEDPSVYFYWVYQVMTSVYFDWAAFNLADYLKMSREELQERKYLSPVGNLIPHMIAYELDQNNTAVIEAVQDIILSDNNTRLIDVNLISGVAKSNHLQMHQLMKQLLLAAKLQEGLRQAILENADDGSLDYFVMIIETILEHDLLRFSSCIRAVNVWMGLGYEADTNDRRAITKILSNTFSYLKERPEREQALASVDVTELYAAMFAESVYSVEQLMKQIEITLSGQKYQKLVAFYFMSQLDDSEWKRKIIVNHLDENDLDLLCFVISNYSLSAGWSNNKEDYLKGCRKNQGIEDKKERIKRFDQLNQMLEKIPRSGYVSSGKPFEWSQVSISCEQIYSKMEVLAGYDQDIKLIHRLIDRQEFAGTDLKINLLAFLIMPERSEKERKFLFSCLSDKSMAVRKRAVEELGKLQLTPVEMMGIENMLSLKTGEIRQGVLKILKQADEKVMFETAGRLIYDKNINKRLGGLNLLTEMVNGKTISKEQARDLIVLMPKVTEQEQILIEQIVSAEQTVYNKDNGFGLYDPSYRPQLPPIEGNEYTTAKFKAITAKEMEKVLQSLSSLIEQHKDDMIEIMQWDKSEVEVPLGGQRYLPFKKEVFENRRQRNKIGDYVMSELWQEWGAKFADEFLTLLKIAYCSYVKDYQGKYSLNYQKWVVERWDEMLGFDDINETVGWIANQPYGSLCVSIINILIRSMDENKCFKIAYGILADIKNYLPPEEWKKDAETDNYYRRSYPDYVPDDFSDTKPFRFFYNYINGVQDPELFKLALGMSYEFGTLTGYHDIGLEEVEIARAVELGYLDINELYRCFLQKQPATKMSNYTHPKSSVRIENTKKHPILQEVADKAAAQIISIEIKRGDLKTPVSEMALGIRSHQGLENFVEILIALGEETLARGYIYSSSCSKREVLSSLLRYSSPAKEDNAEKMKQLIAGRIRDKRLLEAAMYVPCWIDIVQDYLGWSGLKSGAWYFHAHTSNSVPEEFEGEVAKYSPISIDYFRDGAFDINWFKSAHKELGKEKFAMLYDCAKYISDGSAHRRAQLFSDAVLGKLKKRELKKNISEKRNKDQMLSYSLIPLGKNKMKDALDRYEFIQKFLKESKQFGAQRRESEAKICAIALDNLARNLGLSDSLRLSWKMETLKAEQLQEYFQPVMVEDTQLFLEVDANGKAEIQIIRNDKKLKSVPSALKKHSYLVELKELKASLKDQYSRSKVSLERAMQNRDQFTYEEAADLMKHPVIRPLVEKLVFKAEHGLGFLSAEGLKGINGETIPCEAEDQLVIAHCYDLWESGCWSEFQQFAFTNQLIQPFKQIFRELYTVNEDELKEKTVSRRYAGHQIQPRKTLALLKGRSWTVDYDSGLQRVYYKENVIASIYALADWFSPADIEAPTLETVRFYDRKTGDPLDMAAIDHVLFSETMRDVDLVVSVAHVGGVDPETSHSTIEMRAVIIRESIKLMKVDNVTVAGNHAKISGELGEYSVHLGSGVVHKMGKGALNILPVHSQQRGKLFLPFLDEDPKTAEILSKILLLAEDKKIKDPTILSQL